MKLYRAEYRQSNDTILYAHYENGNNGYPNYSAINPIRILSLLTNQKIEDAYKEYVWKNKNGLYEIEGFYGFYKKIHALDSFVSETEPWFPMISPTPLISENNYATNYSSRP